MKMMKYMLSAFALLALAVACNHDPDEITLSANDPKIAAHGDVVVNDNTVGESFTLVWSAARFGAATDVTYTVSAKNGAGSYVELGSTPACNFSSLNSKIFEALDIRLTGTYNLTFKVDARSSEGERQSQPAAVKFVYTKITYLWIFGAYQDWNTEGGPVSRLLQDEKGIFKGFLQLPAKGEFKFSSQPNWDGHSYGPGAEEGTLGADIPDNFTSEAGLYYVEVDLDGMTYVQLPLTSVSLIGEAVGGWSDGDDVAMTYNAASKSWTAIAGIKADAEYKVRFNNMWDISYKEGAYNCSLGGDLDELAIASPDNLRSGDAGITGFTLSLFDYPYHMTVGEIAEDESVLYVASSVSEWNYFVAPALTNLSVDGTAVKNKFYGLVNFVGATSPEVLLARLRSPLGTRFGGTAEALAAYPGGTEATPIVMTAGLRYYIADLSGSTGKLTDVEITEASVLPPKSDTPVAMTPAGAGKWTLTHDFVSSGKISILLNGGSIEVDGTTYPIILGGSCGALALDGAQLNMVKGSHKLVLDLTASVMTLSIDGQIADPQLYPATIGVTGDYGDIDWKPENAAQLWGNIETGTYWGYLAMYGTTYGFKFTYGSTWVPGVLTDGTTYDYVLGSGDNMMIPDGLYRWDVNLDAMTAKATALSFVSLIGDAVGGWDPGDDVDFTYDAASGRYKVTATLVDGALKIRFNHDWIYAIGGALGNLTDPGDNIAVTAGTYDFVLDLSHTPYTMTMTKK